MPAQESVIRRMTRLAIQHNAVNLSQGITDEPVVYDMAWAALAASLGGTDENATRLETLTLSQFLEALPGDRNTLLARPLKNLLSTLQGTRDRFNQYSFPFGLPELRTAIADYTQRFYTYRPDPETQITVTLGATEALSTVLRATCQPGDGILIFQPFHEMYPSQAHLFGLRPKYVTLIENPKAGEWELNRTELARAAANQVRAIVLNTPHNPTGKVFSHDELTFIADLCKKHDLLLITDEIYEHILYGNHTHHCAATLDGMQDRTFIINSISKTANASGWRVGWVLSPPAYTPQIRGIHDTLVVQAPTPLQKGAERLLRMDADFFRNIHRLFQKKRDVLVAALQTVGFQITPPDGAYYLFANYKQIPALKSMSPTDAAMYLIEKIGVASVPGDNFYHAGNDGDSYLRFAFCRHLDTLQEAARRLSELTDTQ